MKNDTNLVWRRRDTKRTTDEKSRLTIFPATVQPSNLMCSENGELPHPRISQRAFVLYPLHDLSPDLEVPGQGIVKDMLDNVRDQISVIFERLSALLLSSTKLLLDKCLR